MTSISEGSIPFSSSAYSEYLFDVFKKEKRIYKVCCHLLILWLISAEKLQFQKGRIHFPSPVNQTFVTPALNFQHIPRTCELFWIRTLQALFACCD